MGFGFMKFCTLKEWRCTHRAMVSQLDLAKIKKALLTDPQTSGGLLVSCTQAALPEVMAVFQRHGFDSAAVIGEVAAAAPGGPKLLVR